MPDPAPLPTPGRLTRRLTADTAADAARLGVSQRTLVLACAAQVAERDFLLSLQADGLPLHRKQATRLRRLARQFPFDSGGTAGDPLAAAASLPFVPFGCTLPSSQSGRCVFFSSMPPVSQPADDSSIAIPQETRI